jgi:hypothetical protein
MIVDRIPDIFTSGHLQFTRGTRVRVNDLPRKPLGTVRAVHFEYAYIKVDHMPGWWMTRVEHLSRPRREVQ